MGVLKLLYTILYIFYAYIEAAFRLIVPRKPKSLEGQIALVTGGGRGIGRETALHLAAKGAIVILWDVAEDTMSSTLKELQTDGKVGYAYTCDVSNVDEVSKVAAQVRRDVGDVDILVNNAGVAVFKRMLDRTEKEIRKTLDVNLLAQFWTVKEFLPMMVKQNKGNIVNIASVAAFASSDYLADYGASKYAVRGMTENLEQELHNQGLHGIKLTTVYPSFTNTAMVKEFPVDTSSVRPAEPSEVAAAIVDGIQRDLREVVFPSFYYVLAIIQVALPRKAYHAVMDLFNP